MNLIFAFVHILRFWSTLINKMVKFAGGKPGRGVKAEGGIKRSPEVGRGMRVRACSRTTG
jgi:hypothetical protein